MDLASCVALPAAQRRRAALLPVFRANCAKPPVGSTIGRGKPGHVQNPDDRLPRIVNRFYHPVKVIDRATRFGPYIRNKHAEKTRRNAKPSIQSQATGTRTPWPKPFPPAAATF
ncbi:hypothetical protein [Szabonella alba]|uniref:Uncharacterized protein n=1 Tax=Szabonella alba TaxID=2804194 RepID=A0A8K0V9Q7_9RHOB|nr:hypothetical protein [Szabonella alba]MBL4917933.1 hypothetical protein [Szabonella alba]